MPVRIAVVHKARPNDYVKSIAQAGAEPVVVDWSASPSPLAVLAGAQGVLFSGGADVNPVLYGEDPHPTYEAAEPGRDWFETELIRLSLERDLPVLAVCRGVQILNVVCGGTLWQDLPSQVRSKVTHQVGQPRDALAHVVEVDPASTLGEILLRGGGTRVPVNSRHHQAIKHLAPGFVAAATAPDGIIEAVERRASRFCVGVQWHPENFWATGRFLPLFEAFVVACTA